MKNFLMIFIFSLSLTVFSDDNFSEYKCTSVESSQVELILKYEGSKYTLSYLESNLMPLQLDRQDLLLNYFIFEKGSLQIERNTLSVGLTAYLTDINYHVLELSCESL